MNRRGAAALGVALGAALGVAGALIIDRLAPPPSVALAAGTEDAFALGGLDEREFGPDGHPWRWAREEARFRFENLPPGPLRLQARVHGQRGPVAVVANGVVVATLLEERHRVDVGLPEARGGRLDVSLRFTPFVAGDGRTLGGLPTEIVVLHAAPRGLAGAALIAGFAAIGAVVGGSALACGMGLPGVAALATATLLAHGALLLPFGLVRSGYANEAALVWIGGILVAAGFARRAHAPGGAGRSLALCAVMLALAVQGLAGSWPAMVVSDVSFHAHNLVRVAQGQWWLTSRTQHTPPFVFPYGVSWYALLAPLEALGWEPGRTVRVAAGLSGALGSAGLYWLVRARGASTAALVVGLVQFLPGVFRLYSFGNLSNVFGQAVSVVFLAWWAGTRAPAAVGAIVLGVAGLAHLSSLLVMLAVVPALLLLDPAARRDGRRLWAAGLGLALPLAYYASFWRLAAEQLDRLGGGSGGPGLVAAGTAILGGALGEWGWPATALAGLGLRGSDETASERVVRALWLGGAALAFVALLTPLETRFVYALAPAVCISAAEGARRSWHGPTWRRALVVALLATQLVLGASEIHESLLLRYRG